MPSDPRGPGLARISSFHGEGSKAGEGGRGGPAGPRGPAWGGGWWCGEGGVPKAGPRCFDNIIALLLRAQ